MGKNTLIIDLAGERATAGVFGPDRADAIHLFKAPASIDAKEAVAFLAKEIRLSGHDLKDFETSAVGLPVGVVSYRVIDVPLEEKKKIDEVISFEAGEFFLKAPDELVFSSVPLAGGKAIAAAVEKKAVAEHLRMLNEAGLEPMWLGASIFSRHRFLSELFRSDATVALFDGEVLTVCRAGKPCFFKEISGADDLALSHAALSADGIEVDEIFAPERAATLIKDAYGIEPKIISPESVEFAGIKSMALEMRAGLRDAVNFRTREFADTRHIEIAKKSMRLSFMLLAAIAILWAGFSILRYETYRASFSSSEDALKVSYSTIFPEDKKISDATLQLEARLKRLKEEKKVIARGSDVSRFLAELARPDKKGIRLFSVSIDAERVVAKGEAGSFEDANAYKDIIEKAGHLKDVTLSNVKTGARGPVTFTITASLKGAA